MKSGKPTHTREAQSRIEEIVLIIKSFDKKLKEAIDREITKVVNYKC